jgi:hypothetical protein
VRKRKGAYKLVPQGMKEVHSKELTPQWLKHDDPVGGARMQWGGSESQSRPAVKIEGQEKCVFYCSILQLQLTFFSRRMRRS